MDRSSGMSWRWWVVAAVALLPPALVLLTGPDDQPDTIAALEVPQPKDSALADKLRQLDGQVRSLKSTAGALEVPKSGDPALGQKLADLETQVKRLNWDVQERGQRSLLPMVVLAIGLAAAVAVALQMAADRDDGRSRTEASAGGGHPEPPSPPSTGVAQERAALVEACIAVRDVAPSEGIREQLGRALEAAGVAAIESNGELFNPTRHRAVARVAATDWALHNVIASTERPGYTDHGHTLRLPEVLVYRGDGLDE